MGIGASLGFSSTKSKGSSWLDPKDYQRQVDNYGQAQAIAPTYQQTSADQIQRYMNPYTDQVIDQSMQDADRYRQMMVNQTSDGATAAGAFGGSRHGVAEALTNQGAIQQFGLLSAQLRNQGYGQALETAQNENQYGYQYPLVRQGLLNSTIAGIQGKTNTKGKTFGLSGSVSGSYGGQG